MIFREIFSSIKHNKARTILILLLMSLTYFLVLMTLTNSLTFYTQISDVRKMFKADLDNTYKVNISFCENEDTIGDDFEELKAFVNSKENSAYAAYDMTGAYFDELKDNSGFIELYKKLYAGTEKEDFPAIADIIYVDPEIFDFVKFDLSKTDFQKIEKNGEKYVRTYAGRALEGIVNIGDTLTDSRTEDKYILAGFFDSKKWFDHSGDPITMPLNSIENYFIMPFSENEKLVPNWHNMQMEATVGKIFLSCTKETAEQYRLLAAEKGIKFNIQTVNESIDEWTAMHEKMLGDLLFLAAVVLICSVISITSTLCVNILLKKREYGIRIAFGSTKQKIILSLCAEFLLLNLIAGAVGYVLSYRIYDDNVIRILREIDQRTLTVSAMPMLIVIMIFLTLLVILIPAILLKRYDPAVLIKEDE